MYDVATGLEPGEMAYFEGPDGKRIWMFCTSSDIGEVQGVTIHVRRERRGSSWLRWLRRRDGARDAGDKPSN